MGEQQSALRALAGKKAASLSIDLENQREQIREMVSRIERKDEEISNLETKRDNLQEHLDLANTEVRSPKERIAVFKREEDFGTRMLAIMKGTLRPQPRSET